MPPLPRSSSRSAEGSSSTPDFESVKSGWEGRSEGRASGRTPRSSSGATPKSPPRPRTTKLDTLQVKVSRMYMMFGTMIRPFGRFYPVLAPIGDNLKTFSDEAAEAWIDLAQQDKTVHDYLEKITGASTWGNVIGIHLAIFASAIPGGYIQQMTQQESDDGDDPFIQQARAMGLSDEQIADAKRMAEAMSTGGPGDTVRTGGEPISEPQTAPTPSGIVSPDELGVTQPGEAGLFPGDTSPPNGSG